MKFYIKLLFIFLFSFSSALIPILLGCLPPRINTPHFEANYLSTKQTQNLHIKTQYSYTINKKDTVKQTEFRYDKNGEMIYSFHLKYGRIPIENYKSYDSNINTLLIRTFEDSVYLKQEQLQYLSDNWYLWSTTFYNSFNENEFIYKKWDSIMDTISNEKIHMMYFFHPDDSVLKDTLKRISYKNKYNSFNKIDTEEFYLDKDTLHTIYTYNEAQQLTSVLDASGNTTVYTYDNNKLCTKVYLDDTHIKNELIVDEEQNQETILTYNDTQALISKQIITYDSLHLVTQVLNYGFYHKYDSSIVDSNFYDVIVDIDTIYSLDHFEVIELNYNLPPETLLFTYDFY